MTAHQDPDWLDEILNEVRFHPRPSYEENAKYLKAAITAHLQTAVEAVIGEDELVDGMDLPHSIMAINRDSLRYEQRQRLAQLLDRKDQ